MPGQHATLSPSASERWVECPASIAMESTVPPETESPYAREGTAAHGLAEIKARLAFGQITKRQFTARRAAWAKEFSTYSENPETMIDMERHTDAYVDLIKERVALYSDSAVMFEQRLDTGVPSCWGTSDAVIFSPVHVEIVDFKYGAGVAVEARGNSQLRLYACGALDAYADILGETELIRITVHQPRMNHILTDEMTPQALRDWRESIIPIAEEALGDDAHFSPTEEACRWCPASGRCRAQLESIFATDFEVKPTTLSVDEMAEVQGKVKLIRDWLNAFEIAALSRVYSEGEPMPGYKVVLSGGQRAVRDQDRAIDVLVEAGYDSNEIVNTKIKGIGDLEKLLGAGRFAELLEAPGIVTKGEGKPALVPESDKRPSVAPNSEAAKEFTAEEELI